MDRRPVGDIKFYERKGAVMWMCLYWPRYNLLPIKDGDAENAEGTKIR